ncbi:argininosuccinate lyase [Ammoniphilus sp. YIM 78166]|uniref:argininosuccinate lyase n=1 Tax=Ammoniphilus sp. YIM 78166 TaxID=1644106 RepID=UPI00142FAFA4|nr:argininosuccinate lyase [Ammoniphilus sp. YIM 78166]
MRERLKEKPAQEMIQFLFEPAIKNDLNRSYYHMLAVSKAHLVMLVEQGVIEAEAAKQIAEVIERMESAGPGILEIDPNLEDLYFNIESYIIQQIGMETGGRMHTGRSRNDLYATVTRMASRESLHKLYELILELRGTLLDLAEKHTDTVMPGYTHMQPAEPVTFSHYLSGILHALERDFSRLDQAYERLNLNPLGSGAMASTTFAINRNRTAEFLGFDNIMYNSIDGVASRDYVLEILSGLSILMINLSRLSQDLYTWATDEFAYIEVGNSVAACSSIMPQKKNPITLEHVKAKAAHLQAAYISASSSLKNTPFTHSRDVSTESLKFYWEALYEVEAALKLLIATLQTVTIHEEQMLARTRTNFSTVTELANVLVRELSLSFREAHHIVAGVVTETLNQKQSADQIGSDIIAKISRETLGKEVNLLEDRVKLALDPILNVRARKIAGGSSPSEVERQIHRLKERMELDKTRLNERNAAMARSLKELDQKVAQIKEVLREETG